MKKGQSVSHEAEDEDEINVVCEKLYGDNETFDHNCVKYINCKDPTDLHDAINKMAEVNQSFIKRVLQNLKNKLYCEKY